MSQAEAVHFDRYSEANAAIVESSFPCECVAYEDVFTYARWLGQGMQVQKGEKSTKIKTYISIVDKESGEITGRAPRTSSVFCRHQVKESAA